MYLLYLSFIIQPQLLLNADYCLDIYSIFNFNYNIYNFGAKFHYNYYSINSLSFDIKEILSRAENIFFLLLPALYFYISNIVKLSQILTYGSFSGKFSEVENRYIWVSIVTISLNIIVKDIIKNL